MFVQVVSLLPDKGECVSSYTGLSIVTMLCVSMGDSFSGGPAATYDDCMYDKMKQLMEKKLKCTVPWLPQASNICTKKDDRKKAFDLYQEIVSILIVLNMELKPPSSTFNVQTSIKY